ncbi:MULTISPECIES: hypothetical protein [Nosocomiicoccus]|uniref:Uncharacterized protein n=1 Tax=Nosocomiicoccus massiliensis TaxID=1232430 RepID=A0AAF0YK34_9STAP|nr:MULTISPECIES: hypothetical protein [Nosocomiicoccus]OFL48703.1 hypothetical protein HMPREF2767_07375 [Nosocomiicoccus sp. HMSC067E10]OFO53216.1 hypothetical protein HMPREF3029_05960 [Nosocomiicoccus sp. HMSC059G07]WOS96855.1 hypothetical protein CJ229_003860 [Nosocomiicoccus massiliensis]
MKHYYFEVERRHRESHVYITNEASQKIGEIILNPREKFDKEHSFLFRYRDGESYFLGLRQRRFKDMNVARYELFTDDEKFKFKERKIHNIMNFRVDGVIDDSNYSFTERVANTLEMVKEGVTIGRITEDEIVVNDHTLRVEESVLFLMYFMFKLYKREPVSFKKYLYNMG